MKITPKRCPFVIKLTRRQSMLLNFQDTPLVKGVGIVPCFKERSEMSLEDVLWLLVTKYLLLAGVILTLEKEAFVSLLRVLIYQSLNQLKIRMDQMLSRASQLKRMNLSACLLMFLNKNVKNLGLNQQRRVLENAFYNLPNSSNLIDVR